MPLLRRQPSVQQWIRPKPFLRVVPRGVPFTYDRNTEQYIGAPAGPYADESIFDAETEAGNYGIIDKLWSDGQALSITADGVPYASLPYDGRITASYREWDVATQDYVQDGLGGHTFTYVLGNATPTEDSTIDDQQAYTNIAYSGPILDNYVSDGDGDTLTFTVQSGTLPTGVDIESVILNEGTPSERTVSQILGTPETGQEGTETLTIRATDLYGAYVDLTDFDLVTDIGVLVPTLEGETIEDAITAIEATTLGEVSIQYQIDLGPEGIVLLADPEAGTYVPPGTPVSLVVSQRLSLETDVTVPYLIGYTQAPAEIAIAAIYCTPDVTGTTGTVTAQDPDAFTVVPRGTTISITLGGAINSVPSNRRRALPPYNSGVA